MEKEVIAKLINQDVLISQLNSMEIDVTGVLGRRLYYLSREVERFIREEIVQLVREQKYYAITEGENLLVAHKLKD